ncbi:L-lactate dehydrogenase complex protein LldG [Pseudonocardia sediminis]|uniref:L-lactate dehydrogenase complex protein LldG n=1 Tax=Pseudonocardia sediminis TaxID=1397368 RepID=A0A4Q7UVE2_PSEST|nr:LUD domain-containing protein [Pseudonocardia sediminis]RZT85947.1 L-lactate dehydrogenase complex protein LldG [Pseudonocardia sediminis]
MNAREEILGRARQALGDVTVADPATDVPVTRPAPATGPATPAQVDLFAERVADYRAVVERPTVLTAADAVLAAVTGASSGTRRILVPPGFPDALVPVDDRVEIIRDGPTVTTAELDTCDGVLSTAAIGIAETGTIVLDHGEGQGRRAATLVPDLHVCVVRVDQVVAGVPEAVAALDPSRPQTWISGPSATSDIELDRVEGVHGPRTLHVLLVGPA